jgi:hypothetical protein
MKWIVLLVLYVFFFSTDDGCEIILLYIYFQAGLTAVVMAGDTRVARERVLMVANKPLRACKTSKVSFLSMKSFEPAEPHISEGQGCAEDTGSEYNTNPSAFNRPFNQDISTSGLKSPRRALSLNDFPEVRSLQTC